MLGGFVLFSDDCAYVVARRHRCTCRAFLPRTCNRAFHPKQDRGGFRTPTLRQNKRDSFCPFKKLSIVARVCFGRALLCPELPAIPALPANRTLGPYPLAYRLAPKGYTRGGQYLFRQALP